jgi:hypothetical protein
VKLHAVLFAIALACCATFHIEPPNQPLPTPGSNLIKHEPGPSGDDEELFVGLAFSGGGMKAVQIYNGTLLDRSEASDLLKIRPSGSQQTASRKIGYA